MNGFETKTIEKEKAFALKGAPGLFDHPAWVRAVEEGLGYRCFGLLTMSKGVPVLLSFFYEIRKGPFRLCGSPLPGSFTPYMDPVWLEDNLTAEEKKAALSAQYAHLRNLGYSYIERRFRDGREELGWTGAAFLTPQTYAIEIYPETSLNWQAMEGRSRNMVRKSEKLGVKIRTLDGRDEELEKFYSLLTGTFSRRGKKTPHSLRFFKSIVRNLNPEGMVTLLSAAIEGKDLSMGLFIHDQREMHFLSGASGPEITGTGASNHLQWEAIRLASGKGIKSYDLGGKGVPSIDRFKESFGGRIHSYGKAVYKSGLFAAVERAAMKIEEKTKKIFFR